MDIESKVAAYKNANNIQDLICTFTVSQWYSMIDAMKKMADIAHSENFPVSWNINFETALDEKELLVEYHNRYGDEIIIREGSESLEDWRREFPWALLNTVSGL